MTRYWYSEKQADVLRLGGLGKQQLNRISCVINGEKVEREYTECTTDCPEYWPSWDDAELVFQEDGDYTAISFVGRDFLFEPLL